MERLSDVGESLSESHAKQLANCWRSTVPHIGRRIDAQPRDLLRTSLQTVEIRRQAGSLRLRFLLEEFYRVSNVAVSPTAMLITPHVHELRTAVAAARRAGGRIGCVPTMGALHAGHLSLMEQARVECDFVVVTLFVNPTQFGPQEDFTRYPRPFESDCEKCRTAGAAVIFHPTADMMYPPHHATFVEVRGLSDVLEGAVRPGHFRGVATVVTKLLNVVQPDKAYFGQKDFQQQALIRRMCHDLDMPVEIITCPTIRDPDGLALSSRNIYLSPAERASGLSLHRALCLARDRVRAGQQDLSAIRLAMRAEMEQTPGVAVDYATIADADKLAELSAPAPRMVALVAAHVGPTRLIDNMILECGGSTLPSIQEQFGRDCRSVAD